MWRRNISICREYSADQTKRVTGLAVNVTSLLYRFDFRGRVLFARFPSSASEELPRQRVEAQGKLNNDNDSDKLDHVG